MKIELEKLKGKSLFVATPMYGGMAHGLYTKSLLQLSTLCDRIGIDFRFYFLFNESLISRARNYATDAFIESGSTHFMFIDGDISFSAEDVIAMMFLCEERDDIDILCGPYPKKTISWEKVKAAVDKGLADGNPNDLEKYVGDYVLAFAKEGQVNLGEPVEVTEAGTGFMMIKRKTLDDFATAYPEMKYTPDHIRDGEFNGTRDITAFFMDYIDQEEGRHLSEDYMFCKWSRKIGKKVWICPWMKISHTGTYTFNGDLLKIASAGLSATFE